MNLLNDFDIFGDWMRVAEWESFAVKDDGLSKTNLKSGVVLDAISLRLEDGVVTFSYRPSKLEGNILDLTLEALNAVQRAHPPVYPPPPPEGETP